MDRFDEKMLDVLNGPFNHRATREEWACRDQHGNPIPWYTFPALEYLEELDLSEKTVFEYGSGFSSLYWAKRARSVISVEKDAEWHGKFQDQLLDNQQILLRPDREKFVAELDAHGMFDIIIIDADWRRECAELTRKHLNPGGLVVLDNSDWYPLAAERLRKDDFLQVDMKGFGPINPYTWCTSFLFDRAFDFPKRHKVQPVFGLGGRDILAEEEWPDGVPDPLSLRND